MTHTPSPDDPAQALITRWKQGDEDALEALIPLVYAELRAMASSQLRRHQGHETLQPTALVNDVFVRLLGVAQLQITSRKHLFTTAARIMRQILVDRARAKHSDKRGGEWQRVAWLEAAGLPIDPEMDFIDLDRALDELSRLDPRLAEMVNLRFFTGLEVADVARMLDLDERTVYRDWALARAWLRQRLGE